MSILLRLNFNMVEGSGLAHVKRVLFSIPRMPRINSAFKFATMIDSPAAVTTVGTTSRFRGRAAQKHKGRRTLESARRPRELRNRSAQNLSRSAI